MINTPLSNSKPIFQNPTINPPLEYGKRAIQQPDQSILTTDRFLSATKTSPLYFGSAASTESSTTRDALKALEKLESNWENAVKKFKTVYETKQKERDATFALSNWEGIFYAVGIDISGNAKIKKSRRYEQSPEEVALRNKANELGHQVDRERESMGDLARFIEVFNYLETLLMQVPSPKSSSASPVYFGSYATMARSSDYSSKSYDYTPPPPPPSDDEKIGLFTPRKRSWSGSFPILKVSTDPPTNIEDNGTIPEAHKKSLGDSFYRFGGLTDFVEARNLLNQKLKLLCRTEADAIDSNTLTQMVRNLEVSTTPLKEKIRAVKLLQTVSSPKDFSTVKQIFSAQLEKNTEAEVKVAVLEAFVAHSLIRPEPFEPVIIRALLGKEPLVKQFAMDYIKAHPFASKAVDLELRRMANGTPGVELTALQKEAKALYEARVAMDLVWTLNPKEMAQEIADSYIGNKPLRQNLDYALMKYEKGLLSPKNSENVIIYLPGEPGIGKTTLAHKLATRAFNMDAPVTIEMGDIESVEDMRKQLAPHLPLAGKVVLLEEFQSIANLPEQKANELLNYLKPIINSSDNNAFNDYKNALIVIASNGDIKQIPFFKSTPSNRGFLQRVDLGVRIDLNTNLRPHLEEFIEGFDTKQLYQGNFPELAGMKLALSAKAHLLTSIQELLSVDPAGTLSGREMVALIAKPIEIALNEQCPNRRPGEGYTVKHNPETSGLEIQPDAEVE